MEHVAIEAVDHLGGVNDGGLIGGAALKAADFVAVARAAS